LISVVMMLIKQLWNDFLFLDSMIVDSITLKMVFHVLIVVPLTAVDFTTFLDMNRQVLLSKAIHFYRAKYGMSHFGNICMLPTFRLESTC
jgi:hypothetical protein